MTPVSKVLWCTASVALLAAHLSAVQAQEQDDPADETVLEQPAEPLDLSTPLPDLHRGGAGNPFAPKPAATDWRSRIGIDQRPASIPAAELQPEQLVAGAIPDRTTGVAWANVMAPGPQSPLGWDQTSIDTRLDPAQEQGKLGTTLSRSVPLGDTVAGDAAERYCGDADVAERGAAGLAKLGQQPGPALHPTAE
jgi:hypothetical protein